MSFFTIDYTMCWFFLCLWSFIELIWDFVSKNSVIILQAIESLSTCIAAIFAIVIYKKNKIKDENRYRNENLPVITIGSPCDVTQNACDINILSNYDVDENDDNWTCLFKLANFSKTTARDISLGFYSDEKCTCLLHSLFIQEVPITTNNNWWVSIYSKLSINPESKKISYTEFNILDALKKCWCDCNNEAIKNIYAKCIYYSSPDHTVAMRIISWFTIKLRCDDAVIITSISRTWYTASYS